MASALSPLPPSASPATFRFLTSDMKTRTMPKRVRTPNCTHVNMDRVYACNKMCFVCGREPSIGFLYECRQDCRSPSLHDPLTAADGGEAARPKSPLRCELEDIGLSESVIRTAEQGQYTPAQLDLLKTQKRDLKQIIQDSIQRSQINDMVAKLASLASQPSSNDGTAHSKTKDSSAACTFRACHTCRPYYRDRVYISFAAVVLSDFPPVSLDEAQHLPTKSARILQSIGAPHQPSAACAGHDESPFPTYTTVTFADTTDAPHTASTTTSDSSELTFKTTQTDVDELRALRRPRRRFYNIGHRSSGEIARDLSRMPPLLSRQGLKTAMQAIFRPGRDSSSSGSMITLPVPRTGTVRDTLATRPVGDFDIGALRRVRRQKEKNEIRNGTYVGGFEDVGDSAAPARPSVPHGSVGEGSCSSDSDFSVYSCISEGSEVEENGVAFTEEAESRSPGVLAVEAPLDKSAIYIRTKPLSWTEEGSEDIGVQSIVAQV